MFACGDKNPMNRDKIGAQELPMNRSKIGAQELPIRSRNIIHMASRHRRIHRAFCTFWQL